MEVDRQQYAGGLAKNCLQSLGQPENPDAVTSLTDAVLAQLKEFEQKIKRYTRETVIGQDDNEGTGNDSRTDSPLQNEDRPQTFSDSRPVTRHVHREALRNSFLRITKDLDLFGSNIIDELIATDVMSESEEGSIRGKGSRTRQNEEFFDVIIGKLTMETFKNIFLPAVGKQHGAIAEELEREFYRLEEEYEDSQCAACKARKYVQVKRLATPLFIMKAIDPAFHSDLRGSGLSNSAKWEELRKKVSDATIIASMAKKYNDFYQDFAQSETVSLDCSCHSRPNLDPDLSVTDTTSMKTAEIVDDDIDEMADSMSLLSLRMEEAEEAYPMTARPRGICLIINNYPEEEWAIKDEENLTRVYKKLEFEVLCEKGLTSSAMIQIFQRMSLDTDHTKFDAFVCCIICNCNNDMIRCSDAKRVSVAEIKGYFHSSACPSLAGKPKMFFIAGSRGEELMSGIDHKEKSKHEASETIIAEEADFLLSYGGTFGFKQWISRKTGSSFIQALTSVLECQADRLDLLSCLLMVNNEVTRSNKRRNTKYYVQTPAPLFTLTKKVNLTSDPTWPHSILTQ